MADKYDIDWREGEIREHLLEFRERFCDNCDVELDLTAMVSTKDAAKTLCSYGKMSGYKCDIKREGADFKVRVCGRSCKCM